MGLVRRGCEVGSGGARSIGWRWGRGGLAKARALIHLERFAEAEEILAAVAPLTSTDETAAGGGWARSQSISRICGASSMSFSKSLFQLGSFAPIEEAEVTRGRSAELRRRRIFDREARAKKQNATVDRPGRLSRSEGEKVRNKFA